MAAISSENAAAPPWRRLEGKVVMVTGASSGLGRGFCLDLARAGCRIVAAARRADELAKLCDQINGGASPQAPQAKVVVLDVSAGEAEIAASVARAWDAFGRIDALVNNAGVRGECREKAIDWPEAEWNALVRTNLTGTWLVSKQVCRRMRDAKVKGSVINISSIGGLERGHLPGGVGYSASKSAVNAITKMMALELGAHKIRVNSIAPGLFDTAITTNLMKKEWLPRVMERTVPLRTYGTFDPALTSIVRYLIHDSSEYVSGNIFIVDAGVTLPGVPLFSSL